MLSHTGTHQVYLMMLLLSWWRRARTLYLSDAVFGQTLRDLVVDAPALQEALAHVRHQGRASRLWDYVIDRCDAQWRG